MQKNHSRKRYPSDLTEAPWAIVAPLLPPAKAGPRGGPSRQVDRRDVLNTLVYLHRRGGPWAMLPHDVLPKRTGYASLAQWRDDGTWAQMVTAWREQTRVAAGREPTPSAACLESQAVKTTEVGGPAHGYDGGQNITGRQRHLWGETVGLVLAILLTRAGLADGMAAPLRLGPVTPQACPRLLTLCADQQYHQHGLDAWRAEHRTGWRIEVQARPEGMQGFTPLEQRWGMERTHAWHGR